MDRLLLVLAIIFVAGRVFGELAERIGQPAVVGEILAGAVLGPSVLGWVPAHEESVEALAELGAIFLLFMVGLEASLYELRKVGAIAVGAAVGGVVLPFLLGWGLMGLLGYTGPEAMFVGTAMVATSVAVTARVLRDKGKMNSKEAQIILAAAVVDDVLALLLLGVVSGAAKGNFSVSGTLLLVAEALIFLVVIGTLGPKAIGRAFPWLGKLKIGEPILAATIAIVLMLAAAAARIGLAAIIGAFLAGLILSQAGKQRELEHQMQPLSTFLAPFFFVHVGSLVELQALTSPAGARLIGLITLLAVAGKVVGSGLPVLKLGARPALIVGVGMAPRGEVGIIVAALGLSLGVIGDELYAVVVAMAVLTTLISPPALTALYRKKRGRKPRPRKPLPAARP